MAANQVARQTNGQKPADTKKMQGLYAALVADSTGQGVSASTQRQLTQANVATIN